MAANSVEFVEQIDAAGLADGIKDQPELGGGLTHELGDQAVQEDGEERKLELTGERSRGQRLAGARWTQQKKLGAGRKAVGKERRLLALLPQHPLELPL